ncbi:MAG TPA: hypothetical protein VIL99_13720 [Ignavibacteria bacterium]
MTYYIDLFSPETYEAFKNSDRKISGFRDRQKGIASEIKPGDKFICYITKISRWFGILEVDSNYFVDNKPIFYTSNDPFVIRFNVKNDFILPLENSLPMNFDVCWENLSFTKGKAKNDRSWTSMVRGSLRKLSDEDGKYLEGLIIAQLTNPVIYSLMDEDKKKLKSTSVKTQDSKQVNVSIPENEEISKIESSYIQTPRDSNKIQALLAEIGERMNLRIWIPRSDRQKVVDIWKPKTKCLVEELPLNYDDATLKTIENIDILWIKGRSIVRAFEVEHTTSIYSGILRMADLMALQPNLNINAHIVAPLERKEKVLQEISRPVFAFLEKGPLSESCTFISYDSIIELSKERKLEYMTDAVLEEYAEYAEESEI